MSVADAFEAAARSALVGTQQQPLQAVTGVAAVDALLRPDDTEPAERALLRAAGVLGYVRRTARRPVAFPDAPAPAADESIPRAGPRSAHDLRAILEMRSDALLEEWLGLARRFERRVPEELLPALFSFSGSKPALHAALRACCGERGRWLAARRAAWSWMSEPADPRATFAHGKRAERLEALAQLRRHDPDAAREVLAATFSRDGASDRAAFLGALAEGLGANDVPFVEACLDDKSAEVRAVALDLAYAIGTGTVVARATALAEPLLTRERAFLKRKLAVRLPERYTPDMAAAGVPEKSGREGVGERSWWFEQILARVPLAHWRAAFGSSTRELFGIDAPKEFAESIVRGWSGAIARYRDAEAAADLLALARDNPALAGAALLANPRQVRADLLERDVGAFLAAGAPHAAAFVDSVPVPWSREFSVRAVAYLRTVAATAERNVHPRLFEIVAERIDPATPGMADGWPETYAWPYQRTAVERTRATIAFRRDALDHLKAGT